jgi:uncharacterized membrane protein
MWIERITREHLRLWICAALGIAGYWVLPADLHRTTRWLIGWDVGVLCYLAATATMMARAASSEIRRHSEQHDEGALGVLILTIAAVIASLAAIFAELATAERSAHGYGFHVALSIATVVLSWVFTHTIFALHYAYQYYGDYECAEGLQFPGKDQPDYWDFVYFSFVIGMTYQVSDVEVAHKIIRRFVVAHGALSFFFSTAIVALMVNIAASAIQQ